MVVVASLLFQRFAHLAIAQDAISQTPASEHLIAFIESVNSSDDGARLAFLKDGFAENDEATLKRREQQTDELRSRLGKLTIDKIVSSAGNRISAACTTSTGPNVVLTLTLTDTTPHKIKSIELEMGGGSADELSSDKPLDAQARAEVINRLAKQLRSKYVYPEVGEKMSVAVEKSAADGDYDSVDDVNDFASRLTDQLREICHDKHLRVRAGSPRNPGNRPGRRSDDNHGFVKVEMLPEGIGYLKFNFFSDEIAAQKTASAAMNFLAHSKALIFDLRENGGGSPEMIAYLSSYLFEDPVHLNSFYNRPTDTTTESWTQKEVPGDKFGPEIPVFVLTSSDTFSGAEEFSYNLRNLNRGTIVGETTGGGAHPVMPVTLGPQMYVTMPFARAINPITNTNWEGVGVEPHVKVSAEQALEKAIKLATAEIADQAAIAAQQSDKTETANANLDKLIQKANDLMFDESFADAAKVYEEVTRLDPKNGDAWFRYGYCLHVSGQTDRAIDIHQMAAQFEPFARMATYNLACAYSLKNQADEALAALAKAIELGFGDFSQLENDSDFDNVRHDKRFTELIEKLKGGE
jgi:tetratricopeptide (TPR) repeat protein